MRILEKLGPLKWLLAAESQYQHLAALVQWKFTRRDFLALCKQKDKTAYMKKLQRWSAVELTDDEYKRYYHNL